MVTHRKEPDNHLMLSAHCPQHGRTVLIPTSRIDSIVNGEQAFTVRWRCSCGERGTSRIPRRRPATV